ncbi:MAG TPA: hypothetical protein VFI73_03830 [Candidatus Nitrosopolaris sp.]|nr:hypothetical protein [Candidatus Nitrosopolaris sp.]
MMRTCLKLRSIVNPKALYIILLLFVTLIFESQLNLVYSGNNSISSGNQMNSIATRNNTGTNNSALQISTDKPNYVPGEKVNVTIKNNLRVPLEFPDSLLGLNIENVKTGQKAGLLAAQVISELKPMVSKTFQWDQKDTNANQVEPGIYKAQTSTVRNNTSNNMQLSHANTTFIIKA